MNDYDYYYGQQILEAQLKANNELRNLRSQINQSNSINNQMLQNQIREIEERETQKFYKNRSFKLRRLINTINNIQDDNQRAFAYCMLDDAIIANINEAINTLNEIADKEYCDNLLNDYTQNKSTFSNNNNCTIFKELDMIKNGIDEYLSLKQQLLSAQNELNQAEKTPPPIQKEANGCIIGSIPFLCLLIPIIPYVNYTGKAKWTITVGAQATLIIVILAIIIWLIYIYIKQKKDNALDFEIEKSKHKDKITELENKYFMIKEQFINCSYNKAMNFIEKQYPNYISSYSENLKMLKE